MNTRETLQSIGERYNIQALYVFGSRAAEVAAFLRGEGPSPSHSVATSDVDVGVRPVRHLSAQERVRLMLELEDLLGGARVDLVILPEAPASLAAEIVAGELVYTTGPGEAAEYELYCLRRAGDQAFLERERRRMILTGGGR